jgi:hypothetical protein
MPCSPVKVPWRFGEIFRLYFQRLRGNHARIKHEAGTKQMLLPDPCWFFAWLGKRWIIHTLPIWLWGHSLFKISSLGLIFYGTKWLLWRPHKQTPTFHTKCGIDKGLIERGSTIDHWRSRCMCRIIMAYPLCNHSFIHSFIFFNPENGGEILIRNVRWLSSDYMALYPRRQNLQSH